MLEDREGVEEDQTMKVAHWVLIPNEVNSLTIIIDSKTPMFFPLVIFLVERVRQVVEIRASNRNQLAHKVDG